MKSPTPNLFAFTVTPNAADEIMEVLAAGTDVRIERIISAGHASPPGFWYDQEEDEWVAVLQGEAELEWADGRRLTLRAGDGLIIPAREHHRVARTSASPPCIWLAVFAKNLVSSRNAE